jgi:hypothetical protein
MQRLFFFYSHPQSMRPLIANYILSAGMIPMNSTISVPVLRVI